MNKTGRILLAGLLAGLVAWVVVQYASWLPKKRASHELSASETATGCAILLHGLGRTHRSMSAIELSLLENGYTVWNESYPSTRKDIPTLSKTVIPSALAYCHATTQPTVHFVTHSLGGIVLRQYLQDNDIPKLGHVVMIGPPNQGSEIIDLLGEIRLFQLLLGPAAGQLGTGPESVPNSLEPVRASIGIIAGNESSDPWFSPVIEGEDDGKVSVESTRLPEMADMVTVEHGHTFIMSQQSVVALVLRFLASGSFRDPAPPDPVRPEPAQASPKID